MKIDRVEAMKAEIVRLRGQAEMDTMLRMMGGSTERLDRALDMCIATHQAGGPCGPVPGTADLAGADAAIRHGDDQRRKEQTKAIADAAMAFVRARRDFDDGVRRGDAERKANPFQGLSPEKAWEALEALVPKDDG
jgi:hypothetical protein